MIMSEMLAQAEPESMTSVSDAELFRLMCSYPTLAPGGGLTPLPAFCQPVLCADVDFQAMAEREQALVSGLVQAAVNRQRLLKH